MSIDITPGQDVTPARPEADIDEVPFWDHGEARPLSAVTESIRRRAASRRSVLKLMTGSAMGLGIASLGLIPQRAFAAPVLSVWDDCRGYITVSQVCVPSTAYYSSSVCNGTWHKSDSTHTFYNTSCDGRNAWRWHGASGSGHSTLKRKCSDGSTKINGSWTFSICRTAL